MKLLAMLKSEIDKVYEKFNLHDLQENINRYFEYIKRFYVILVNYKTLNYHTIADLLYDFTKDLENENFHNLENLVQTIKFKIILRKIQELSKNYDKINIRDLSEELAINEDDVIDLVISMMDNPENPIKVYNSTKKEVIFNKNN